MKEINLFIKKLEKKDINAWLIVGGILILIALLNKIFLYLGLIILVVILVKIYRER